MRSLDGLRLAVEVGDRVVAAREAERPVGEQPAEDGDRLGHPLDAHAGRVELQADRLVLGFVPAGPDPDVEPAVTDDIERREILGDDGWVAQVVVQHERADAEPFGRDRGGSEHRDRRKLRLQVVVDAEMRVADGFGVRACRQRRPIDDLAESRDQLERRGMRTR